MAKRRHRPVLQESHAAVTSGPIGQPAETEFGPPTKSPCDRSEAKFKHAARAVLGADMVDEHNLTTRPDHANKFVECSFGLWHSCNDKLGHDDIEGSVWQRHPLGVHHGQKSRRCRAQARRRAHALCAASVQTGRCRPVYFFVCSQVGKCRCRHRPQECARRPVRIPAPRPRSRPADQRRTPRRKRGHRRAPTAHRRARHSICRCPPPYAPHLAAHRRCCYSLVVGALIIGRSDCTLDESAAQHSRLPLS